MMLSVIAAGAFVAAFSAWEARLIQGANDKADLISGLGDAIVYVPREEDFHTALMAVQGRPRGIFRRGESPLAMPDEAMFRVKTDAASGLVVYTDDATPGPAAMRYFLKVAKDSYLEFGERNHWPPFDAGKPQ